MVLPMHAIVTGLQPEQAPVRTSGCVALHSNINCATSRHVQVWDYNRSAEMRDTEGGASQRSVLQQAQKLRDYLATYQ